MWRLLNYFCEQVYYKNVWILDLEHRRFLTKIYKQKYCLIRTSRKKITRRISNRFLLICCYLTFVSNKMKKKSFSVCCGSLTTVVPAPHNKNKIKHFKEPHRNIISSLEHESIEKWLIACSLRISWFISDVFEGAVWKLADLNICHFFPGPGREPATLRIYGMCTNL